MIAGSSEEINHRLESLEGHLRGVCRMVERGEPAEHIMRQIYAVQQGLAAVMDLVIQEHLEDCLQMLLLAGDEADFEKAIFDLKAMYKMGSGGRQAPARDLAEVRIPLFKENTHEFETSASAH